MGINLPGTTYNIVALVPGITAGTTDAGNGGASTAATMAPSKSLSGLQDNILYFGTDECNVRMIELTNNIITHVAGSGCGTPGGDGIPATSAVLAKNTQVTADSVGNIFLYDTSFTVRKIDVNGIITTIAGQMNVMQDVAPAGQDATAVTFGGMNEFSAISLDGHGECFDGLIGLG